MRDLFSLFIFFFCFSCTYHEIEPLANNISLIDTCITDPNYQTCIVEIIQNNCIGCHEDYDEYNILIDKIENRDLLNRVKTDMPPPQGLGDYQIEIIENWISNGYENN
jgi:hypothetical protein